jgi:hypothetical protein
MKLDSINHEATERAIEIASKGFDLYLYGYSFNR